jgi:glycosyltransferase involved in cell wall biosynthesis
MAYRFLPSESAQLIEARFLSPQYDAVISWSEQRSVPFAMLKLATASKTPHIAICYWIANPRVVRFLKFCHAGIDRFLIMSSSQREFALSVLGIPEKKIVPMRWCVDHKFWRPMGTHPSIISSSGREYRDYQTLIRAIDGTGIPCHIAAKVTEGKHDKWITSMNPLRPFPPGVSLGINESIVEVREVYAKSRFIVVPLLPTTQDIGSTVILEAMAMGKAVICSRTEAQKDIVVEDETGLYVKPEDPRALRQAIEYLWNNPHLAAEMGAKGRARVEQLFTFESWLLNMKEVVQEAISEG